MYKKFALATVCVLMLVLQACSNTSPTPTSEPTETATLATFTSTPTSTVTPTSTPTPIPLAWQQISDGQAFERDTVTAFATDKNDPDVIYAAMKNSGVYKTIDGGLSWQPAIHGLETKQVESLLIDSQNPRILYAGTMGGVFKTEDDGENWFRIGDGTYLLMDLQDNSHLYARDENGIYETKDQGKNWTITYVLKKDCPNDIQPWAIQPANGNVLFAASKEECAGVYRSNDGGRTWKLIGMKGIPNINSLAIGMDEQGVLSIYAHSASGAITGGLYASYDEGLNWSITDISGGLDIVMADTDNPSILYSASKSSMFVKRGKGDWQRIPNTQSIFYSAVHIDHPNGTDRILASGTNVSNQDYPYISIFISTDGGASWNERDSGLGSTRAELVINPADSTGMYLSTYYPGGWFGTACTLYRSLDVGKSWSSIRVADWCGPAFDAANVIHIIQNWALQRSWNGGETWLWEYEGKLLSSGRSLDFNARYRLPDWDIGVTYQSVSANPYIEGLIYAVGDTIYYSPDSGVSWQKSVGSEDSWDGRLFYTDQSKMIFDIGKYHQAFSTDNGVTWQNCGEDVTASQSDTRLALDVQGSLLYLATLGQGVMVSNDSCQSWQSSNNGLSNLFVNTLAIDPNNPDIVYAGTDGGAYISFDSGQNWSQVNDGLLGATVVYSIAVDPESNVYAATPYGIFKLEGK
jgi:photosystem II stability/assembly factor-like uncharacterized protein